MSFKHCTDQGILYGFIPQRLAIAKRPELNLFPLNVMFAKYKVENGKTVMGSALYEPDLGSFRQGGNKRSMEYHNINGGRSWLIIEYDLLQKSYMGNKLVNDRSVGVAVGADWKMFFVHFTGLGLSDGEICEFRDVKSS